MAKETTADKLELVMHHKDGSVTRRQYDHGDLWVVEGLAWSDVQAGRFEWFEIFDDAGIVGRYTYQDDHRTKGFAARTEHFDRPAT